MVLLALFTAGLGKSLFDPALQSCVSERVYRRRASDRRDRILLGRSRWRVFSRPIDRALGWHVRLPGAGRAGMLSVLALIWLLLAGHGRGQPGTGAVASFREPGAVEPRTSRFGRAGLWLLSPPPATTCLSSMASGWRRRLAEIVACGDTVIGAPSWRARPPPLPVGQRALLVGRRHRVGYACCRWRHIPCRWR
jgi:hypothetical protein